MQDNYRTNQEALDPSSEEFEQLVAEWKAIYDEIAEDEIAMSEAWLANSTAPTLEPYDWSPAERDIFSA